MAAKQTFKVACKTTRPLMSTNFHDARLRALGLYRAFYRYIPYIVKYHDITQTEHNCRCKLREYFYRNAFIKDFRVIDLLVIKGYMELKEVTHQWQQKGHIAAHWHQTLEPKPNTFVGKFLEGID